MKRCQIIVFVSIILIATSCTMSEENDIITTHPTSHNMLQANNSVHLSNTIEGELSQEFKELVQFFNDLNVQYRVDTHDSFSNQIIGMIDDVAITTSGKMYILDSRQFTVHKFNSSGDYVEAIGRNGHGPGEFTNPQKILIHADSLLIVSDATKVELFNISSEPEYVKTVHLNNGVNSICTIGDTLFTFSNMFLHHQMNNDEENIQLVHAYSLNSFQHTHSFGKPYLSQHPDIVQRLSAGFIVCNEESETVSFLFQFIPVLHAYSATTGEREWSIGFDDVYLPNISTTLDEGRVRFNYSRNERMNDVFFEPITLEGSNIMVQLRRSFQDESRDDYYASYIIDSKNGTGSIVSKEIPHVITRTDSHLAIRDLYSGHFPSARLMVLHQ